MLVAVADPLGTLRISNRVADPCSLQPALDDVLRFQQLDTAGDLLLGNQRSDSRPHAGVDAPQIQRLAGGQGDQRELFVEIAAVPKALPLFLEILIASLLQFLQLLPADHAILNRVALGKPNQEISFTAVAQNVQSRRQVRDEYLFSNRALGRDEKQALLTCSGNHLRFAALRVTPRPVVTDRR